MLASVSLSYGSSSKLQPAVPDIMTSAMAACEAYFNIFIVFMFIEEKS